MAKIMTTLGEMEESLLEKKTGGENNENESTSWVEYWKDGVLVHRSVSVVLKSVASNTTIGVF